MSSYRELYERKMETDKLKKQLTGTVNGTFHQLLAGHLGCNSEFVSVYNTTYTTETAAVTANFTVGIDLIAPGAFNPKPEDCVGRVEVTGISCVWKTGALRATVKYNGRECALMVGEQLSALFEDAVSDAAKNLIALQ